MSLAFPRQYEDPPPDLDEPPDDGPSEEDLERGPLPPLRGPIPSEQLLDADIPW